MITNCKNLCIGFNCNALKYIFTYFKTRKQCAPINNVSSDSKYIISGVPRSTIVRPILFNAYLKYFSFALEQRLLTILLMLILYHHLPRLLNCYWKYYGWIRKMLLNGFWFILTSQDLLLFKKAIKESNQNSF